MFFGLSIWKLFRLDNVKPFFFFTLYNSVSNNSKFVFFFSKKMTS